MTALAHPPDGGARVAAGAARETAAAPFSPINRPQQAHGLAPAPTAADSPAADDLADRLLCSSTARLLQAAARVAGGVAAACAVLAAALLLIALLMPTIGSLPVRLACLAVLLTTPIERVLLLRLRLDAGLFADLAASGAPLPLALRGLDQALATLKLRPPVPSTPATRPLADRVAGARRLLMWHASVVLVQAGISLGLLAWLALTSGAASGITMGGQP